MKKMKLTLSSALALFVSLAFLSSCDQEENLNPNQDNPISEEVMSQLTTLGFDVSDITTTATADMQFLDLEEESGYLLEGDLVVTPQNLKEMLSGDHVEGNLQLEQYRTNNLVSQGRTIRVIGYTGNNANGLDSKMQTALQWAVNNYNALNINLNFTLAYGTNYQSYDMVVYRVNGNGGGSAGFPSGGAPNKFIRIQSGTSNFSTNVVEHVITHEMGHSVGLRHTDYFDRRTSCGVERDPNTGQILNPNEGQSSSGALHIPGTPTSADLNSIMLACFSSNEDGEFGSNDRTALEYLY